MSKIDFGYIGTEQFEIDTYKEYIGRLNLFKDPLCPSEQEIHDICTSDISLKDKIKDSKTYGINKLLNGMYSKIIDQCNFIDIDIVTFFYDSWCNAEDFVHAYELYNPIYCESNCDKHNVKYTYRFPSIERLIAPQGISSNFYLSPYNILRVIFPCAGEFNHGIYIYKPFFSKIKFIGITSYDKELKRYYITMDSENSIGYIHEIGQTKNGGIYSKSIKDIITEIEYFQSCKISLKLKPLASIKSNNDIVYETRDAYVSNTADLCYVCRMDRF